jgi:membrane-bound lytic murein transglycosylase B
MHVGAHHVARSRLAGTAAALTLAAGLLASCNAEPTGPDQEMTAPTAPADEPRGLPAQPSTDEPVVLARQLDQAAATLRDAGATAGGTRRAGELQQLGILQLATASRAFRHRTLSSLSPSTAQTTRSQVRAARLLRTLTGPEKVLPRWRIVAPPPAAELLGHYRKAQRRTGVPWTYLAAIHLVETRMGRIRGTSNAGAQGPMQFMPATWELYGGGGDIDDPRDAILAAARLLRANGAPGDMSRALWHYNQSDNYVRAVTEYARTMQRSPAAYRGYWHWRVLFRHTRGTVVLPVGYPRVRPVLVPEG